MLQNLCWEDGHKPSLCQRYKEAPRSGPREASSRTAGVEPTASAWKCTPWELGSQ